MGRWYVACSSSVRAAVQVLTGTTKSDRKRLDSLETGTRIGECREGVARWFRGITAFWI